MSPPIMTHSSFVHSFTGRVTRDRRGCSKSPALSSRLFWAAGLQRRRACSWLPKASIPRGASMPLRCAVEGEGWREGRAWAEAGREAAVEAQEARRGTRWPGKGRGGRGRREARRRHRRRGPRGPRQDKVGRKGTEGRRRPRALGREPGERAVPASPLEDVPQEALVRQRGARGRAGAGAGARAVGVGGHGPSAARLRGRRLHHRLGRIHFRFCGSGTGR